MKEKLQITADFEIFKIRDRVFQIGFLEPNLTSTYADLFDIINLGFKFIPTFFNTKITFFSFFNYFFDDFLHNLNKILFFSKLSSIRTEQNLSKREVDFFDNLFKSFKKYKSKDNKYPLQYETLEFEFEFYKEFSKLKFKNFKNNISLSEFSKIKDYFKNKPFKILNCDKNIGTAIISQNLYLDLSNKHLEDKDNFTKLTDNPLDNTDNLINDKLTSLVLSKDISSRLAKSLIVKSSKLGKFNILPKLHKSKFGTRPIINCIDHPTANISQCIDYILQPYVKLSESYIKDSQHLIQKLEKLEFPENIKICSLDFESLYSNINLNHALETIFNFIKDKLSNNHLSPLGFYNLLKLLFENNIFSFNGQFYKQIKGIAMGSKCGPSVANIYLSCLEKSFLFIHKPLFYGRYIDDILCILFNNFDIDILVNFFGYLKLNLVCDKVVNFLDLNISYDDLTRRFKFSLYIKPTNTFSYLLTSSNHPDFVIINLPKGIFIRIRRINSSLIDYYYFSSKIALQLTSRGYEHKDLLKLIDSIAKIDRTLLLKYKEKIDYQKNITLVCKLYDINLLDLNFNLLKTIDNLSRTFKVFSYNRIQLVSRMQTNLGSLFINNVPSFLFETHFYFYKKCKSTSCNICNYANQKQSFLYIDRNLLLFFKNNSSCNSTKFVYIIKCKRCSYFYIGQSSKTVKDRISQHLNSIRNFILFIKHTPVSNHFNLKDHSISDFTFCIYQSDLSSNIRLLTERKIIKLFLNHKLKLMNIDSYSFLNTKHIAI